MRSKKLLWQAHDFGQGRWLYARTSDGVCIIKQPYADKLATMSPTRRWTTAAMILRPVRPS
jgi:hypothetical protein